QQQQQQNQGQMHQNIHGAPKQTTGTPLSPNPVGSPPVSSASAAGQNGHPPSSANSGSTPNANAVQSQQALETWKKITRVFITHGNSRISRDLGIQLATPDSSMFLHVSLSDIDSNHALCVPQSASTILLRPTPGPLNSNGKTLLVLSANGRRYLPRVIADSNAQLSDNGINEDSRSLASDDNERDESVSIGALVRSANYAYEVPLQTGMNFIDVEVLVADWKPETFLNDNTDQQVPPAQSPSTATPKPVSKHYLFFLTRT
ncbi:hypothetical protein FB639_005148, partial [Coemansia asiatica]